MFSRVKFLQLFVCQKGGTQIRQTAEARAPRRQDNTRRIDFLKRRAKACSLTNKQNRNI